MEDEVNPLERDHSLSVVLPGGLEMNTAVHGSKPVMDLLVALCASYHLNPSDHTVELLSANKNIISFKPNSPIGSLEAEKIVLKPKGVEEKPKRTYMPEASVRLLINYRKSHKAVVRVNPRVPLVELLPAVCRKCEFKVETTVLLRDTLSPELLDLTMSLNEHGLRELFAKDTADLVQNKALPKKEKKSKEKENKGFLGLFRRKKKKSEMGVCISAPTSPGGGKQQLSASMSSMRLQSSNTLPACMPKKRRAPPPPPPPPPTSQSAPNSLGTHHLGQTQSSAESTLTRTKRRAPPPPPANPQPELPPDTEVSGTLNSLHPREELGVIQESDSVNRSPSPSPQPTAHLFSSPTFQTTFQDGKKPCLPRTLYLGKELPQARFALAQILTTSMYNGKLVTRLKNSDTFSKLHSSSAAPSAQKRPDDGSFACLEDFTCNLSDDTEWEDPIQRKGLTTFKVVPSKQRSYEVEVTLEVPVRCQVSEDSEPVGEPEDNGTLESPAPPERPDCEITASDSEVSPPEIPKGYSSLPPSPEKRDCQDDVPDSRGPLSDPESPAPQSLPIAEVENEPERSEEVELTTVTSQLPPGDCLVENDTKEPSDENGLNAGVASPTPQSPSGQKLNQEMPQPTSAFDVISEEGGGLLDEGEDPFPPPPPPIFFSEELDWAELDDVEGPAFPSAGQHSSPAIPMLLSRVPSRFAQAVALAVQKSRTKFKARGLHPHVDDDPQNLTANTVPGWLSHTSSNGNSCLG